MTDNVLLHLSPLRNHAPQFDKIREDDYKPATLAAIAEARANIDAIIANPEAPSFDNTIVALETASETLGSVTGIFCNQLTAAGTDGLQALAEEIGPVQANFSSDIVLNDALFARIKAVHDTKDSLPLTTEQKTLLDDTDKPWFAIDRSPLSPFVDRKYVPQATDWLDCLTLGPTNAVLGSATPAKDDYEFVQLASVDLQADGDVYVGFYHEKDGAQGLSVARSADGGATFLPEVQVASTTLKVFTSITGIMYRLNLSPYLAVDRSDGPYRDRIYYTFTDNEPAQDTIFDVYLAWSDNDGATWTTPKKVHPATAPGTQQFYSSIYVTENGTLLLGWYDRRNDPADLLTDFYLGISHDGGVTFQEVKVTSTPTDFSTIGLTNAGFGIGDYGQIVATPHTALPFWADGRTNDGDMNVYFARVPLDGAFVGVPEIMTVSEHISFGLPYPIPATDAVHIPVHNLRPEHFTCRVLGTDGKLLATHQAGLLPAGKNELTVPLGNPGEAGMVTVETAGGVIRTFKVR